MRKLLFLMALCFGTAGAINLSQLKLENVCWTPDNEFDTYDELDEISPDTLGKMPESMIAVLSDKIKSYGFKDSDNCTYYLSTSVDRYQFSNSGITSITASFSLSPNVIEDEKSINISTKYETTWRIKTRNEEDVTFTSYHLLEAVINAFLADWKQAHP